MNIHPLKSQNFNKTKYRSHPLLLCGKSLIADMSGALYWPDHSILIIADMHLEKGSHYAARGQMLPPYDTRDTLLRLTHLLNAYETKTIVALGDSFHDRTAFDRMSDEDRRTLELIQQKRQWIWVSGNHDPDIAINAGGTRVSVLHVDGLILRHEPSVGKVSHEIAGHMHPAARLSLYGGYNLRRPCFISSEKRLIMPAFGSYTGGLNILDSAFSPMFAHASFAVNILGKEGIYPVPTHKLRPDHSC